MQLYYIRHAQSKNNALYVETGSEDGRQADPEITEIGWLQARYLADFLGGENTSPPAQTSNEFDLSNQTLLLDPDDLQNLQGYGFTHLYCSLMVRSIQTASVVAKKLGLPLVALNNLHEGGGIFQREPLSGDLVGQPGNDRAYFETNFPQVILPDMNPDGWWNRPFEPREARIERAHRLLNELLARHDGSNDKVALISHGGFYNYFIGAILRLPSPLQFGEEHPRARTWLSMNNVAITRVDFVEHEVRLVYHNRLNFLPANLVT